MRYSIKIGDQTYSVEIEDLDSRPVKATVDGDVFEVWPEEETSVSPLSSVKTKDMSPGETAIPCPPAPLPKLGASPKAVTAPIPGVIIEITATIGQSVNRGDTLCVLEAMKMKNLIRAGRSGVIASINIHVGDQVRHGQTLMEFSD